MFWVHKKNTKTHIIQTENTAPQNIIKCFPPEPCCWVKLTAGGTTGIIATCVALERRFMLLLPRVNVFLKLEAKLREHSRLSGKGNCKIMRRLMLDQHLVCCRFLSGKRQMKSFGILFLGVQLECHSSTSFALRMRISTWTYNKLPQSVQWQYEVSDQYKFHLEI